MISGSTLITLDLMPTNHPAALSPHGPFRVDAESEPPDRPLRPAQFVIY